MDFIENNYFLNKKILSELRLHLDRKTTITSKKRLLRDLLPSEEWVEKIINERGKLDPNISPPQKVFDRIRDFHATLEKMKILFKEKKYQRVYSYHKIIFENYSLNDLKLFYLIFSSDYDFNRMITTMIKKHPLSTDTDKYKFRRLTFRGIQNHKPNRHYSIDVEKPLSDTAKEVYEKIKEIERDGLELFITSQTISKYMRYTPREIGGTLSKLQGMGLIELVTYRHSMNINKIIKLKK